MLLFENVVFLHRTHATPLVLCNMINNIGSDEHIVWNIFSERSIVKDFPIPCCISTTQCYSFLPLIFNCVTHHNCNIHAVVNRFCVIEQIAVWYLRRYDSFIRGHNKNPVATKTERYNYILCNYICKSLTTHMNTECHQVAAAAAAAAAVGTSGILSH